jgi:hypothetical protein
MIPGVVASETGRAQTLQVFICSQMNKLIDEYLYRGCDITQDQARELKLSLRYLACDYQLSLIGKVKNRRC